MVIFLNNGFRTSIAYKLLIYFIGTGSVLFGALLAVFLLISDNFANLAVEDSMRGISEDMETSFYLDAKGNVRLDDSEIMLKWGADALYSNLGYRLIALDSGKEVIRSVKQGVEGALIDAVPHDIAYGYSRHQDKQVDNYRMKLTIGDRAYHLDVMRSDLLGKLANEAVLPAIMNVSLFAILIAFILFIVINIIAIRLIVKPVRHLSAQVKHIQPDDLTQRIDTQDIPNELMPIIESFNEALSRVEQGFNTQKRFVADAAHELRTPLTILLSRLQLSLDDSDIKSRLLADTGYMSRIVEQLLDLSRAQNMAERDLQHINLLDVVKDIMSMLAPLAIDSEHNLALVAQVDACDVWADAGELSVVIKNLIENAIKHTPNGSDIVVTVNASQVIIEDSGEGIPEAIREKIFDRFWRANQSDLSGSGLGLAITQEILSHYAARLAVSHSETLGGAKFTIYFLR